MSEHRYMYPTVVELPRSAAHSRPQNGGQAQRGQASADSGRHLSGAGTPGPSNELDAW